MWYLTMLIQTFIDTYIVMEDMMAEIFIVAYTIVIEDVVAERSSNSCV